MGESIEKTRTDRDGTWIAYDIVKATVFETEMHLDVVLAAEIVAVYALDRVGHAKAAGGTVVVQDADREAAVLTLDAFEVVRGPVRPAKDLRPLLLGPGRELAPLVLQQGGRLLGLHGGFESGGAPVHREGDLHDVGQQERDRRRSGTVDVSEGDLCATEVLFLYAGPR